MKLTILIGLSLPVTTMALQVQRDDAPKCPNCYHFCSKKAHCNVQVCSLGNLLIRVCTDYVGLILSKLKSGECLTPPKANVCGERCARAVRACGARVRCAIYARSDACSARYTRAMIVLTPCWNIYAVYTSALGLLRPQHSISMASFTVSHINWNG